MRKKITMLFALLLACVGVTKAQTVMGLTELPTTAVDLSTTDLTTGYYLIKQTNTAKTTGFLKAASEAVDVSVAPNGTPTAGADTEAAYIWYVEVAEDGKFSVSTANKVAGWQAPTQKGKNLVAYDSKATTLELEKDFASLNGTTQTLVKAYWSDQSCYSYVHDSGNVLGSWNDQNTASLYYIEFYAVPAEDLIVYDPVGVAKAELSSYIAEVSAGLGSKIALQTSDANAAGYLSSGGSADGNVEGNMIDGKNDTFYGSPWGGSIAGVDYQYWQVDLGDEGVSMKEFVFSYVTRANGDDTPYSIVVKGSNDGSSFENLATISEGLPQSGNASYTSSTVSNPSSYRYLRFDVTDARKGNGANPGHAAGGHTTQRTFALAEFELINKDEASWSEHEKAIKTAIDAAQEVLDNDDATVEAVAEALHNVKVAEVVKPVYPFTVTTDDANPVLYAIKSGRGDAYWYTYDATDGKIALSQYTGAQEQQWFFKEVLTEDYQYAVQLYPYADATKAMSYENTNNAAAKIVAQVPGTEGWTNLWVSVSTDGAAPYGLQTYDKKNYLSNNGGTTNKMGMWNAAPASDSGTAMYFSTPAEVLQALIDEAEAMTAYEGTTPGYYTAAGIAELETAIEAAKANMASKNYSVTELNAAIAAVEVVPVTAGLYRIVSANAHFTEAKGVTCYTKDEYYGNRHYPGWATVNENDPLQYWTLEDAGEGKFNIKAAYEGNYITTATSITETAKSAAFVSVGYGQFNITLNGDNNPLHANSWNWGVTQAGLTTYAGSTDSPSAWTLVAVTETPEFTYELNVGEVGYATLMLAYNAEIPAGVTCHTVAVDGTVAKMTAVEGNVLPAKTPVIVTAEEAKAYTFTSTDATATVSATNELEGTLYPKLITAAENTTYYVLAAKEGVAGLYKATLNQSEGTAFLNNANKVYLPVATVAAEAPAMFSLGRGEGTTSIEQVAADAELVIYDLAGRRVEKMEKGIYIVNGKKVIK